MKTDAEKTMDTAMTNYLSDLERELARLGKRVETLKHCFRVSGLINSTIELEEVLEAIMTTSRSTLSAESCSLMLVREATGELFLEVAQGPVADQLKTGFRLKPGEGIAGHVFETGKPLLVEDAYADPRFQSQFDLQTGYRTRSILCVPLRVQDRTIGVAQLINRLDGLPFSKEDEETFALLAGHAAIAIENARMHRALLKRQQMESDLAFATNIQLSFLPQETPRLPGYAFRAHYRAALEVGGDFYDFIPLEGDRLGILIGDVSGKGVASALYMAKLTSDFRLLAIREREPGALMSRVNDLLCARSRRGMFTTMLYMVLDPSARTVSWVNAGHLPPLLWNAPESRYVSQRGAGGPPAGIVPEFPYQVTESTLLPGDCVLLATDGLTEAVSPAGDRLGMERLEALVRSSGAGADGLFDRVTASLGDFVGDRPAADDTTIVVFGLESA